ncbi:MAG: outer membrane protein assembly factor BamA, partial [Phycisphaerae bacterium]|nr:outer membrane protein assembly factor BamA [Phycisphaerae bacterium]
MNRNRNLWPIMGLAIVTCLSLCTLQAQPLNKTVVKVLVKGNERLSVNAVLSYVKTRVGSTYEEQVVKADRDRLMTSGRFESVVAKRKYTPNGVVVTFVVTERPVIARLAILGGKKFSEDDLMAALALAQGDPLNRASIEAGKQAILTKYHGEGYHFAKVTVDPEALAKREVIYRIVEGPRTIIKKVIFDGNHYFNKLSLMMKTSTKAKFWPFIKGELNTEKIQRDVTLIRNTYVAEGFLDAEVGREFDFSDDKTKVKVRFIIKEGPRYRINNVIFKGNTVFATDELVNRLNLKQGTFFTQEVLRRDVKVLEHAYGEIGYIEAVIRAEKRFVTPNAPVPAWARDVDGGKPALINMVFTITEHDQYRIGAIRIIGNSITQERVIRRECRFFPEQLLNTVAVEGSKNRLKQLRLFENITITPIGTKKNNIKDVVIEVKEGRTAEFLVGVGVSSNSGLMGTVSFTQRNFDILAFPKSFKHFLKPQTFKGAGQTLSVSAEPGTEMMRFSINWFTPYIFDQPYSVGAKTYLFTRGYTHYDETRLGAQMSLGHRFKNRWYGELATRFENIQIDVNEDRAAQEIIDDGGMHNLIGLRGSLIRDRTDSRWLPSTGDRFQFSYEQVVGTDTFG